MSPSQSKFFLTTPIYYVNARPHIGHAYTTIVADVLARRSRAQGIDTWFLTGTDEHGQKIERSAQAAGIPPQLFADQVSAEFRALWDRMGLTYDQYIRTTDPAHKRGAQKLFADLHAAGHIYLSTYTGQYSIGEEMFVEGPPGTIGPDGRPTETVTEENFFFRLSAFQLPLIDLIESDTLKIRPESSRNEVLGFLRGNVSGAPSSTGGRIAGQDRGPQRTSLSVGVEGGVSSEARPLSPTQEHVILSEARSAQSKDPEEASPALTDRPTSPRPPADPIEPTGPSDIPIYTTREPAPTDSAPAVSPYLYSAQGTPYIPGALRDLSVSRSSFPWGIPVPEPAASEASQKHVIYVWLDALANYMTAVGYGSDTPEDQAKFARYWPANLHLVGKEITRFHCVYWPAFLLALNPALRQHPGQPMPILSPAEHRAWAEHMLPKEVVANGWLLFDNSKMSKSKGNIVRTETILDAFGTLCPPPPPTLSSGNHSPKTLFSSLDETRKGTPSGVPQTAPPIEEGVGTSAPTPHHHPPHDVLSEVARKASDESKDPEESSARNHSPGTLSSPHAQTQEDASSGLQPAEKYTENEGALAPGSPIPATTGAPTFSESHPEQGGVSDEVRPLSPESPSKHQRDLFAADVLRYYLLREIPFGQDGSFSFEALITRYNADLANGYGNLVSRTLKMIHDNFSGVIPSRSDRFVIAGDVSQQGTADLIAPFDITVHSYGEFFGTCDFAIAISAPMSRIAAVDRYISDQAPWKLAKRDDSESHQKLCEVLYTAAESIRIITLLLHPVLPYATAAVWRQLGLDEKDLTSQSTQRTTDNKQRTTLTWGGLKPGTRLGPLAPIFPRADKGLAQIMADMETQKDLQKITDNADAATPTEFKEAPIASLTGQRFEAPAEEHHAPTHPAAPPRTSSLAEPNPGSQVAASTAHTTERLGTPSHSEAPASGIFSAPFIPEAHPGMSGSTPEFSLPTGPADASPQITIDDFAKIELRVAQILVCERIPKADKLLRLEVDLGYEKRQILSGIAEWYTPEELVGRRIVVITNLAPRKMRGLESHGMLLAASTEGGKPHLATFTDAGSLPLGSRLK